MVYIKMKRNTGGGADYFRNLLRYIKIDRLTGKDRSDFVSMSGYGVDFFDLDHAYHQIVQTQTYFGKTGYNPLVHYIVCFDCSVTNENTAMQRAYVIADYFKHDYQVIWGIHHKPHGESLFHVHFLVNSVNYHNGRMIDTYKPEVRKFAEYVHKIQHCRVRYSVMGFEDDV